MTPQAGMAATVNDSMSPAKAELANVRWLVHKDAVEGTSKLRLVIDTTGPVKVNGGLSESDGPHLTIDVKDGVMGNINDSVPLDGKIADKVSFINQDTNSSQINIDLANMIDDSDYKIFTLPADRGSNNAFRVVIDINKPVLKEMASKPNNTVSMPVNKDISPAKAELTNVRWLVHKDAVEGTSKLRLVIDTTGPVKVNSGLSENAGPQLTIDVKDGVIGKISDSVSLDGKIADKVSFIKKDTNKSQIIVDLTNMIEDSDYKVFTLPSDSSNNKTFRMVVDINKPVPKRIFNFTQGLKGKIIAIDAGHGGSDPGAIGPSKIQEKSITLAVAQKVKTLLERAGAKVIMTRQTDVDVYGPNATAVQELQARANIANVNKADVFVSIHINAFTNPTVGGVANYYYQKTGYDAMLAKKIQDNLAQTSGLQDRGINAAGFYVIKRTEMPAVLAELGFISNPNEERILNTLQFQQNIAQGMVRGLEDFFAQAARKGGGS